MILLALLCLGGILTVHGQDLEWDIRRLSVLVDSLEEQTTEDHLEVKEELATLQTKVEGLEQSTRILANHTEKELRDMKEHVGSKVDSLEEQTTEDHLEVKEELAKLQNNLMTKVEGLEDSTRILADHTEMELRDMKEELTNMREYVGSKVDSLEGELREVTDNHLEVREELAGLQRDMNSTLYLLQELRSQLVYLRQENSGYHRSILAGPCSELPSNSQSGYYWLRGLSEKIYCDMDRQSCKCGSTQGWMRVANIDMTDPNQQCPDGFRLRPDTTKRMCEMTRETGGCTSTVFPTHSVQYSRVCGRIQAYQYGALGGFYSYNPNLQTTVSGHYADGVSVTHGQNPRNHIWTFVAALDEQRSSQWSCPCTRTTSTYTGEVPPFIGNDYFCDTGSRQTWENERLYLEDPLWDGEGCSPTSSCCQFNSPPWFCKELPQPTTDDIEVRVCRYYNQYYPNQPNIPFDVIELYVQ